MEKKIDFKGAVLSLTEDPENKVILVIPKNTSTAQARKIMTQLLQLKEQAMQNGNSSDLIAMGPDDCRVFNVETDPIIDLIIQIDIMMGSDRLITVGKPVNERWVAKLFNLIGTQNKEVVQLISMISDRKRTISGDLVCFLQDHNLKWILSAFRPSFPS